MTLLRLETYVAAALNELYEMHLKDTLYPDSDQGQESRAWGLKRDATREAFLTDMEMTFMNTPGIFGIENVFPINEEAMQYIVDIIVDGFGSLVKMGELVDHSGPIGSSSQRPSKRVRREPIKSTQNAQLFESEENEGNVDEEGEDEVYHSVKERKGKGKAVVVDLNMQEKRKGNLVNKEMVRDVARHRLTISNAQKLIDLTMDDGGATSSSNMEFVITAEVFSELAKFARNVCAKDVSSADALDASSAALKECEEARDAAEKVAKEAVRVHDLAEKKVQEALRKTCAATLQVQKVLQLD
ncbi:hypothetical protein BC830DRAFT_1086283 [Chytriomyces sp. MP71]|nr:hypothetical protein BC830DRAFT_1086283 [Chytriomyces sp. MP71]